MTYGVSVRVDYLRLFTYWRLLKHYVRGVLRTAYTKMNRTVEMDGLQAGSGD